eukprot:TRINITY_DN10514_c0_g1_i1.p1 TRINITY_DN10514_c0_g1~~TRINITY_DN10514_c0_g1_i1.p1  ORF type:complete len:447 (+),score=196.80 TRINITY_DN10514_c0_g1_i1:119-1342(+)
MAEWQPIEASIASQNTSNPIRKCVDQMLLKPETDKAPIPLSIGDPCTDGNLLPPQEVTDAMTKILQENKYNGYPPSAGYDIARASIAKKFSGHEKFPCAASDVFVTSGASHALQMVFDAFLQPGDSILLPQPGFSLYKTICDSKGFKCQFYNLLPEKSWECDLESIRASIDSTTKVLFINNPSNPCGSNFSRQHLLDLLKIAEEFKLPVVSDEIYDGVVFDDEVFTSIATLTETVPTIVIGGLAKQYIIPGWRLGWCIVHDRQGLLANIKNALLALSTLILGPNSLVQAAVPAFLEDTPATYTEGVRKTLEDHAKLTYNAIEKIDGLTPVKPQGAMYCMVGIDLAKFPGFTSEIDFSRELLREQAVMVLPGGCFAIPNYFRIVFTKPKEKLLEAYERIAEFCDKHRK